jgi:hypothetical protein
VFGGCLLALIEGFGIVLNSVVDDARHEKRNLPPSVEEAQWQ